jgi:hypothetical protein
VVNGKLSMTLLKNFVLNTLCSEGLRFSPLKIVADEAKELSEVTETAGTTPLATLEPTVPTETTTPTKFTSALLPSQQSEAAVSQNAFVSGSNMNGGCVMTGRPSSRVLAPPGGHTSIRLG